MSRREKTIVLSFALAVVGGGLPGCGAVSYTAQVLPASRAVDRAEAAGAKRLSPYEYYSARAYLEKAREEAAEASYEDAIRFAKEAERRAEEATDQATERARETRKHGSSR